VTAGRDAALESLLALRVKQRVQRTLLRPVKDEPKRELTVRLGTRITFLEGNALHLLRHYAGGTERETPVEATYTFDSTAQAWKRSQGAVGSGSDLDEVVPPLVPVDPAGRKALPDPEWKSL
jgi:hypothetical protein